MPHAMPHALRRVSWALALAACTAHGPAPARAEAEIAPPAVPGPRTTPSPPAAPSQVAHPPVAVAATPAGGDAEATADSPEPPEPTAARGPNLTAFDALEPDPPPPSLTRNSHYWVSNEHGHHLWREAVEGLGGGYVGVGTDQNYLLAAWARSEVVVLLDFDQAISDLHHVYFLLLRDAATPEDFLASWRPEAAPHVEARIALVYAEHPRREAITRAFRRSRKLVYARLRRVARTYRRLVVGTFLTDAAQYEHLRSLVLRGRVFTIRGDLTGDRAMRSVAAAFAAANVPVNVLYLSNAEQYFEYGPSFRRNVLALPFGPHAVVLRTLGWSGHGFVEGEKYHYNVQPAANFARWMRVRRVPSAGIMLSRKRPTDVPGSSILDYDPPPSPRPPVIAP